MEIKRPDAQISELEIIDAYRKILKFIGEDPTREGLMETPARVMRSWKRLFGGYAQDPIEILSKTFQETNGYDEMIVLRGIELYSTCEHHMLPFVGIATVAYLPDKRVVGISKLARLVECYARRLQIQERLTQEIADAINSVLMPKGVAVVIKARHYCMTSRGVEKQNSEMVTSAIKGVFRDNRAAREEFFSLCG